MTGRTFEEGLFVALLVVLVWAPIPLGSNRPWAWAVLEVSNFALLGSWSVLWAMGRVRVPTPARRARPVLLILLAWIVLQGLQILPLPSSVVARISPESYRMFELLGDLGEEPAWMSISVDPHATVVALFKTLSYAATFLLVLLLVDRRSRVGRLAKVLVYAAVVIATYGVFLHVSGAGRQYFGLAMDHQDSSLGTFANRNHFAGYLEMTLSLGIGLLIAGLSDRGSNSWKEFFAHAIDWILSPKMVLRLGLCVLVIGLTTTHSRMGNTAFFASLLVAGGLGIILSRYATRNTVILLASLVAIDLFIVGSWFGVEKLAERLHETTVGDVEVREEPARYAMDLVKDYPVFGSGAGSFYVTFPRYRPETVTAYFDYAHNDYIQFACESGLLGLLVLAAFVVATLGAALMAQWQRRDPLMRGISFACIMGVTSLLIHSWVDFNLQIPSNATYFLVLCALGWISLFLDRQPRNAVLPAAATETRAGL